MWKFLEAGYAVLFVSDTNSGHYLIHFEYEQGFTVSFLPLKRVGYTT